MDYEIVRIDTTSYNSGSTMGTATGDVLTEEGEPTGERVTIGCDWRPLRDIAEALEDGQDVVSGFEDWQVLNRWTETEQKAG